MFRIGVAIAALTAAWLLVSHAAQDDSARGRATLVRLTGPSPFSSDCNGQQTGTNYRGAATEPFVAADPSNASHMVGAWQQDRWLDGGSSGTLSAVTFDAGRTWTPTFPTFSRCSGGSNDRASDPWVAISPGGTAYQIALGLNDDNQSQSVEVSLSADGGLTWGDPVTLIFDSADSPYGNDKESITADPNDPRYVYAVWNRSGGTNALTYVNPAWFSRSTDGGATWEPARMIYDPGLNTAATGNQIAVLPDGTLVDIFIHTINVHGSGASSSLAVVRSTDHGATWSPHQIIAISDESIGVENVKTQFGVRTGAGLQSQSVDPRTGTIYVTWEDGRFSGHLREGIAFSKSIDGGLSWSAPVQVNQVPGVQAFTPAIAIGAGGSIAITYYDFRQDTPDPNVLLANLWRIVSTNGGATWREEPLYGPFDLLGAARSGTRLPFLGDYQGLAASHDAFLAFFPAANTGNGTNPSSIFTTSAAQFGGTMSNGHTEINRHPRPFRPKTSRVPRLPAALPQAIPRRP